MLGWRPGAPFPETSQRWPCCFCPCSPMGWSPGGSRGAEAPGDPPGCASARAGGPRALGCTVVGAGGRGPPCRWAEGEQGARGAVCQVPSSADLAQTQPWAVSLGALPSQRENTETTQVPGQGGARAGVAGPKWAGTCPGRVPAGPGTSQQKGWGLLGHSLSWALTELCLVPCPCCHGPAPCCTDTG